MPKPPSKLDPARRRRRRHIAGSSLAGLAVAMVGAVAWWAPPARANLLVTLLGVVVTGYVGWRSSNGRR